MNGSFPDKPVFWVRSSSEYREAVLSFRDIIEAHEFTVPEMLGLLRLLEDAVLRGGFSSEDTDVS